MAKKRIKLPATGQPREIVPMPVDCLLLDEKNPRLASIPEVSSQPEILEALWTEMSVDELVFSIAMNGFFQEEPLFVIPEDPKDENTKYIVIEGNRRLAAVLILRNDDIRRRLRATDMPTIDKAARAKLDNLPVSIYENRQQLWTYLSFRHINSPQAWDSFSKAKYVAQVHEEYGVSLKDIADRIGDRHSTVERLYRGYKVFQQAERQIKFDVEDRISKRFSFSHLYTALLYDEYRDFLGVTPERLLKDNPVPKSNLSNLRELMEWLFGKKSEDIKPIIRKQNPDLRHLSAVISKPSSLALLRSGYSLDRAYETSIGDKLRFRENLVRAKEDLQQAKATVTTGYDGNEELYITIQDVQAIAESIRAEMERRRTKNARK